MQNKIMPTIKFVFKHLIVSFFHIQPGHIKTLALIQIRKSLNRPLIEIREQLPVLLNHLKLKGNGVEIGVWEGHFSECIIVNSHLAKLFSIDPWKKFDKKEYDDIVNVSQAEFEEIYHSVVGRLKKYGDRSKIIRATSLEASKTFNNNSLDFIYIDANHSCKACREDLELWWPKLKKGGIFAGHDFLDAHLPTGDYGVRKAVTEFVAIHEQRLFISYEKEYPSWYLIKK